MKSNITNYKEHTATSNKLMRAIFDSFKLQNFYLFLLLGFILLWQIKLYAGDDEKDKKCPHEFKMLYNLQATSVKDQGKTGTCWSFATTSFIESELLRMGKGEFDLAEMYFVKNCYLPKAKKYVRYHGTTNFGEGGQAHDVLWVIENFGFVPQEVFNGKTFEQEKYDQGEMTSIFDGMMKAITKTRGEVSPVWPSALNSLLDIYLGKNPETFLYDSVEYTPKSFVEKTGFNPDDYYEFTSYSHHPFYERINLEIPDNWLDQYYYNIPIDDIVKIMDYALANGYTVAWDGDVGGDNFLKPGYAVIPEVKDDEKNKDDDEDDDEEEDIEPEIEKVVTQEMRQKAFDSYSTTDDHLMHVTGLAENQNGTKFYYTKNSWGTKKQGFDGYWYMSEQFVRLKTIAILVHKDAVPKEIIGKLQAQ
ncbi:MAG: C1 family peptidase [bacterium]